MPTDGMTIRLHLKRIRVVRVIEDEIDRLVVEVADTLRRMATTDLPASRYHPSDELLTFLDSL